MAWSQTKPLFETPSSSRAFAATAYDAERPPIDPAGDGHDPLIGQHVDHFQICKLIGDGGMGMVYLAQDLSLERPVAIKLLRRELADNEILVRRLILEAQAQARLQHPNVVTIYHIGTFQGAPYFAMEYVRGLTLAELVQRAGPLPWGEALEYVIQTARALATAYDRGMIHRDIKPSNLILGEVPTGVRVPEIKVADFGLAVPVGTVEGRFVGTPYYAAPEQIAGQPPTLRGDIYALAITFYELLTGTVPFRAENLTAIMALHGSAERPAIPAERAPWRLRQLINEMMDPDPAKRPGCYKELIERLESVRPKPRVAGGMVPRAAALAVDLMLIAPLGQISAAALSLSQQVAASIWLVLFGAYYVACQRLWGKTIGKRLLGLRIVGTTRPVRVPGLLLRFIVSFWGPLVALAMITLQLGAATDLGAVKDSVAGAVGVQQIPLWNHSTESLLRMFLVPNLMVAVPWLCGFLFALLDRDRQALHDRAGRTRVIYEIADADELPHPGAN